jgi:ABC-type Fe3+ transport system permease subunit
VLYSQDNVVLSVLLWQLFQYGQPAPSAALACLVIVVVLPVVVLARRYLVARAVA